MFVKVMTNQEPGTSLFIYNLYPYLINITTLMLNMLQEHLKCRPCCQGVTLDYNTFSC